MKGLPEWMMVGTIQATTTGIVSWERGYRPDASGAIALR
jgi:hypothetical protein